MRRAAIRSWFDDDDDEGAGAGTPLVLMMMRGKVRGSGIGDGFCVILGWNSSRFSVFYKSFLSSPWLSLGLFSRVGKEWIDMTFCWPEKRLLVFVLAHPM
jgi:hypothetical protein